MKSPPDSATDPPKKIAFDETPAPLPATFGPTLVPHPLWGADNDPQRCIILLETNTVEL